MSLRTVSFQDTYWSGENDLIKEFYVPCMEESIEYCRAVGYFNSSILCYITNGLLSLYSKRRTDAYCLQCESEPGR